MALEIERKFLVDGDAWRESVGESRHYRQGYLAASPQASVRVRSDGHEAHLNIKAARPGRERLEYDYAVPLEEAVQMLEQLCGERLLEKTRHWVRYAEHVWEIDVFEGLNRGLIVAEIELSDTAEDFQQPPWLGREVTHDVRFYNNYLAENPYTEWRSHE